jgi:hypothetical protein
MDYLLLLPPVPCTMHHVTAKPAFQETEESLVRACLAADALSGHMTGSHTPDNAQMIIMGNGRVSTRDRSSLIILSFIAMMDEYEYF